MSHLKAKNEEASYSKELNKVKEVRGLYDVLGVRKNTPWKKASRKNAPEKIAPRKITPRK